jgi:hypothetical protein
LTEVQDMMKEPIMQMGTEKMILRHVFHKPSIVQLPDTSEWERGSIPIKKWDFSVIQMSVYKKNEGTGAGEYSHGMRQRFYFSLGQYTTVFYTKLYAVKAYTVENIKTCYWKRNIYFLSDSQVEIKAFENCKINSKLVWDCHQSIIILAERNNWCWDIKGLMVIRLLPSWQKVAHRTHLQD